MVRVAARATASKVMAGSTRSSLILVFSKSSPLATLAFIGHARCEAHHRIAVSTPSFVAAMCCGACLTNEVDGSIGVSRTAACTRVGFCMIRAAAVVAPLPHPMMETFLRCNASRTASTSSAIASVPMFVSLPAGMTASLAPRGATEMTLNFVMAVPNVSSAFSVKVRVSGPYSRSGNRSKVRGDEPEVAFRRYNEI